MTSRIAALALLTLALAACDAGEPPLAKVEPLEVAPAADVLEQLRAIGYVSGTQPAGGDSGVAHLDPARVQPGLNFVLSGHAPSAQLMDVRGNVLYEWHAEFAELFPDHPDAPNGVPPWKKFWRNAQLLPDGSIVAIWNTYGIFKLDRDSRILWARPNRAHHELYVTAAGDIVHLTLARTRMPEFGEHEVVEDYIVVLSADGVEQSRLPISQALRNADWPALRSDFWKREEGRKTHLRTAAKLDPFHTNSLWLLSREEASRLGDPFRAGQALVSMCLLDTIAAIDLEAGRTVWWQTGPFALQHQPRVTNEGEIVLFNNHAAPRRSSVQILDPRTGAVVWEYFGPDDSPLHSNTSSTAQMLANGNVLIVESEPGRVLEVTRDREIVWQYRNPHRVGRDGKKVASVFQVDRMDGALLAWLDEEEE